MLTRFLSYKLVLIILTILLVVNKGDLSQEYKAIKELILTNMPRIH